MSGPRSQWTVGDRCRESATGIVWTVDHVGVAGELYLCHRGPTGALYQRRASRYIESVDHIILEPVSSAAAAAWDKRIARERDRLLGGPPEKPKPAKKKPVQP